MPDEEMEGQEVAEQPDKDMEAGFDLGIKDEDEGIEPVADEETAEEKSETPVVDEKELTAKDKIEQRIKEEGEPIEPEANPFLDEPVEPVKQVEPVTPVTPVTPPEPKVPKALTREQVSNHFNSFSDDSLPEESVFIGDIEVNLKEFAEQDPEQFAAVKVLSSAIAQQAIDKALKDRIPSTKIQEQIDKQQRIINSFMWWDAVTARHADGKKIKDDPDFHKWFDAQPANVQRFGYADASPDDAILILDFYKEDIAKKSVKKHDNLARDKKKQTDDLHKDTMRTKNNTGVQDNGTDMDDAEAGFNEGLKVRL